ncbi:hypothetical protein GCM10010271_36070 [Streptomyces kurssanovii]|nr:hypothetical protein GCM10010271_36070 [Streptomyces kurssanovii]
MTSSRRAAERDLEQPAAPFRGPGLIRRRNPERKGGVLFEFLVSLLGIPAAPATGIGYLAVHHSGHIGQPVFVGARADRDEGVPVAVHLHSRRPRLGIQGQLRAVLPVWVGIGDHPGLPSWASS